MFRLLLLLLVQDAGAPPWEARKLADIPVGLDYLEARINPDQVVYEAKKGENFLHVVGNTPGEEFDAVEHPILASRGKLFAYRAQRGGKHVLVTSSGIVEHAEGDARISPDGKRLAYVLREKNEGVVMLDGRRGPPFVRARLPVFSQDSATIVYTASRRKSDGYIEEVIVRGEEITPTPYQVIWEPFFHPDGKTLVYPAKRGEKTVLVVGGKEGPAIYGAIYDPVFTRDGKHVAYHGFTESLHLLALDHEPVAGTAGVNFQGFGFSPAGKFWYHHWRYNWPNVVLDGKDLRPPGESASTPEFDADGSHVAFIGSRNGKESVYLDGKVVFEGERFNRLALSPDGKTVACAEWVGGIRVEVEEKVTRGSMVRAVVRGGQAWMRIGAKKSEAFDEVWEPVFSPDSKWVGFGARKDREISWQVMKVD